MHYTKLYITVDDGEISFEVPTDYLEKQATEYGWTLAEFMEEYTSDESSEVYAQGMLDGVVTL